MGHEALESAPRPWSCPISDHHGTISVFGTVWATDFGLHILRRRRPASERRARDATPAALRLRAVPESTLMLRASVSAKCRSLRSIDIRFGFRKRTASCSRGATAQLGSFRRGAGLNACLT